MTAAVFAVATLIAFVAALATFAALVAFAALAAFVALAAFIAALAAAAALTAFADEMATAFFEHKALRATGNRNRDAITALEFIPGGACGRRNGDAFITAHFIASGAMWRWNRNAAATLQHVAGRAFGAVLMEAGTAASVFAIAAAGQCHRATRAKHEEPDGEECREAWLHRGSLTS